MLFTVAHHILVIRFVLQYNGGFGLSMIFWPNKFQSDL